MALNSRFKGDIHLLGYRRTVLQCIGCGQCCQAIKCTWGCQLRQEGSGVERQRSHIADISGGRTYTKRGGPTSGAQ